MRDITVSDFFVSSSDNLAADFVEFVNTSLLEEVPNTVKNIQGGGAHLQVLSQKSQHRICIVICNQSLP